MGMFDRGFIKTVGTIVDHEQKKELERQGQEYIQHKNRVSAQGTADSLEKARAIYGEDAKLGYLYYSRVSFPLYKEYFVKEEWLRNVHEGRYLLYTKEDLAGWNPDWGDIVEEYTKWCIQKEIPTYNRRQLRLLTELSRPKYEHKIYDSRGHLVSTKETSSRAEYEIWLHEKRETEEENAIFLAIAWIVAIVLLIIVF